MITTKNLVSVHYHTGNSCYASHPPPVPLPLITCCWVTQSCRTLWNSMDRSTPGLSVLHHPPELAQTHVHRVSDAIQPSHPLLFLFPAAFNLSQHQSLFQWVSPSYQVAKVLELQLQHQVLPINIQDWFALGLTGWISLQSKGLSRVFNTTIQKQSINSSVHSVFFMVSHIHTWLLEKA